jgi:hypothetical protein
MPGAGIPPKPCPMERVKMETMYEMGRIHVWGMGSTVHTGRRSCSLAGGPRTSNARWPRIVEVNSRWPANGKGYASYRGSRRLARKGKVHGGDRAFEVARKTGDVVGTPEARADDSRPEVPTESRVRNRHGLLGL